VLSGIRYGPLVAPLTLTSDAAQAIGHTAGGVQLQDYASVGVQGAATRDGLALVHGEEVHVTVVAINRVGLHATFHLPPVRVDHTPPLLVLRDTDGAGAADVAYQVGDTARRCRGFCRG